MTTSDNSKATTPPERAPLIIWTFRRTGGTTLGAALFERLPFDYIDHEPFNADRLYGHVLRDFRKNRDEAAMSAALEEICARRPLLKHCVEMVPSVFNAALVRATLKVGYRHLFLYRRHPFGRLLSLYYAENCNVWGKGQASDESVEEAVFAQPLPVEKLAAHEKDCRIQLKSVFQQLRAAGVTPAQVAFEDIYATADAALVRRRLLRLLALLGMQGSDADNDGFIAQVGGGEQGTRDKYSRFLNYGDLKVAIEAYGPFEPPEPEMNFAKLQALPEGIAHLQLWSPQPERGGTSLTLSGLLLPQDDIATRLWVEDAGGRRAVETNLPSPAFASQMPDAPAARNARFSIAGVRIPAGGAARLLWPDAAGNELELARLTFGVGPFEAVDV